MEKIKKFLREEDGMELSEYAVVGGILLVGAVAIITAWGANIVETFTAITDAVDSTPAT
jgi:pilus assembly protein Flp/PilA